MLSTIGSRLKTIRKEKGMTLQELAEKTELSIGLLSNVERNLRSPTIINFHKICNALGITITEVLDTSSENLCVKKDEREVVFTKVTNHTNVVYTAITQGEKDLKGMCMEVRDNSKHISSSHVAPELGIIIQGSLEFEMENEIYNLSEGDSIYVPAGSDHTFKKTSKEICISYWISSNSKDDTTHSK